MKQPKPEMIVEHDNEVADDHIAVISETEKKLQFVRSALAKWNLELLEVAEARGCLRRETTRRIAEKGVTKIESASLEMELDEATSIPEQAQQKIDSSKLISDDKFSKAEGIWKSEKLHLVIRQVQNLSFRVCEGLSKFYELKSFLNHPTTIIRKNSCDPQSPKHVFAFPRYNLSSGSWHSWAMISLEGCRVHHTASFQEPKVGMSFSPHRFASPLNAKHPPARR
jgi:hypothetical protein